MNRLRHNRLPRVLLASALGLGAAGLGGIVGYNIHGNGGAQVKHERCIDNNRNPQVIGSFLLTGHQVSLIDSSRELIGQADPSLAAALKRAADDPSEVVRTEGFQVSGSVGSNGDVQQANTYNDGVLRNTSALVLAMDSQAGLGPDQALSLDPYINSGQQRLNPADFGKYLVTITSPASASC